jgi:tetratricopeptide (TPR) repeat protein
MNAGEAYRLVMAAVTDTNQDRAVTLLRDALGHDPQSKLACYHLGMIYAGRGLYELAIKWYLRIVTEIEAGDPGIWFLLARQHHLNGNLEQARTAYLHTFELDPMCEKACLYISQILVQQNGDAAAAVSYAERAFALRPKTSMVDSDVFEGQLRRAREYAAGPHPAGPIAAGSQDVVSDIRKATLRYLLLLRTEIGPLLERHGIRCAGCAGYEDETLERAAADAGSDLDIIVHEIDDLLQPTLMQ